MDEMLLIDKPVGLTSFGVVARVRRKLSNELGKKVKVGHTGTLDPFASGLMIILTGKECKNANHYSKLDKSYRATICLGKTSTTGDVEGEIKDVSSIVPSREDIEGVISKFIGEIIQTPPIYSAIKIDGKRAYDLARKGKDFEMPSRKVTIYDIKILSYTYPELVIETKVSSGTYIRTLASDIGDKLKTGAYTKELRRLTVGEYNVKDAKTLLDLGIVD
jgi:tRNA pseudouridine synthase B